MMARAVLLACLVTLLGVSAIPTASAAEPCIVGTNAPTCVVSVEMVVCVTEPCDPTLVCVGYGLVCV